MDAITAIHAKLQESPEESLVVIGDLNARFGGSKHELLIGKDIPDGTCYAEPQDTIESPNPNAKWITNTLKPLVLLNDLCFKGKELKSALTFRQGKRWTSELDVCLVTVSCLNAITEFTVHQRMDLPSDHAPISVKVSTQNLNDGTKPNMEMLIYRSNVLGTVNLNYTTQTTGHCRKPVRMGSIDKLVASVALSESVLPVIDPHNVNQTIDELNQTLYSCAERACGNNQSVTTGNNQNNKWIPLLESNNHKSVWQAINWNGYMNQPDQNDTPSDEMFKEHFETLLNPRDSQQVDQADIQVGTYIPLTDDPIQPQEVDCAINMIKSDKSGGPTGIPPGILKLLPATWIVFLSVLFSNILASHIYPIAWSYTKLVTLFKKGSRHVCDNYRGISLMDSVAKLYDIVISQRLNKWFQPDREQAGAQKGRGCMEHILTLRMLIDYVRNKRLKLYIIYVDFSKAYDRVPRDLIIKKLIQLGCGAAMVLSIAAIYQSTPMILGTAIVSATIGVRQGSPTSCFLFTLVVNDLIQDLKRKCLPDSFLGWLHALMLMDDTILLATSREKASEKIKVLMDFCDTSGMVINCKKTKFMVINGENDDLIPFKTGSITITNCTTYTYLGSTYTQDGKIITAVKSHCKEKMAHVLKFDAFVKKNSDFPFKVKLKVFEAAVVSSITYGCESWLSQAAIASANTLYMSCVKALLGVRKTTPSDLCIIETGLTTLSDRVTTLQQRFFRKMLTEREYMVDDPFMFVWLLVSHAKTPCARYIESLMTANPSLDTAKMMARVKESPKSRYLTYRTDVNTELVQHPMYRDITIPEHNRIVVTRIRLSSHNMAIEKGRWSRVPRDQRLCSCGEVQTEAHIISQCPSTSYIREQNPEVNFNLPSFFDEEPRVMVKLCVTLTKEYV